MSEGNMEHGKVPGNVVARLQPARGNNLSMMDKKLNLLNEKVDKLLSFQEDLNGKLQKVNRGIDDIGKNIDKLTASQASTAQTDTTKRGLKPGDSIHPSETENACSEMLKLMRATQQDALKHKESLEKIEKMVDTVDKVITFVGETFKNSKVVDFILRGIVPWKKGNLVEILMETKDKPEEKGAKPKHVPSNRGVQAESKESLEGIEPKGEEKLDENNGACEKVNSFNAVVSKVDSSPQVKERTTQLQTIADSGKTNSSKNCQPQKDTVITTLIPNHGLPFINHGPVGNKNVIAEGIDKDRAPGLEEHHGKPINQKSKESENKASTLSAMTMEAVPSTSKSVSRAGCEVIRTRISINVQMTDTQEKFPVAKEGSIGGHGGTSSKVKSPFSSPLEVEGVKHLTDKFKQNPCPPNTRTDPIQEVKGVKLANKHNEQELKLGKPQMLLNKVSTDKKPLEKSELKCNSISSQSTTENCTKKDLGAKMKSHKETRKTKKESTKDARAELELKCVELESTYAGQKEVNANQCTGEAPENTTSVGASKAFGKQNEGIIDDSPPPPAPFEHRVVSVKQTEITTCYSVCRHEVLGGGRFGQVHKCTEVSTGLNLAAKIIKVKGAKEREEVKNEINIMNQLNHVNLIQLYDAFECKNNLTLVMEYVDGGELFDRITDENYHLTELDSILFTKQICEGVHYIHQQYILHLDLKPENILCINRTGNQIKIIDFGLARRYKPREKLKVNFGTPEFLAPEVVNYDFVSFPTDMWSVGVITYMLLSGLSPFLGETDAETMNYIVNCSWDFDAEAFEQLSEEAKDFISKLLVKEKSCRMSAAQCLKHEWLNDLPGKAKKSKLCLKSQLLLRSYMAHRKWKKHFYVVAAANRLRRFPSMSVNLA
ncbi:myosin light chain kinase 3 isoform X2 [Gopherus flavomarginatus]|uniref:myosin light chain kinase 3 isoform X2 n=1 Tax=Gopherus flavomarginatus TaxID=286002 RepID=UPI0021CB9B1E|nr:myosin light chain kinase 3 isoform X2 [Gopherus flavomarginatus]